MVNAKSIGKLERSRTEPHYDSRLSSQFCPSPQAGRLERTKSLGTFTAGSHLNDGPSKKTRKTSAITASEYPVSKIVQERLRIYERLDEVSDSSAIKATAINRSLSTGVTPGFIPESVPTARTNTHPTFSPAYGTSDPSFAAAHRTNIRSRIRSFQEHANLEVDQGSHESLVGAPSGVSEEGADSSKSPGKLTCTFKGVVDALISHGRQNNTEIGVLETSVRRKSLRVSRPSPSSPVMTLATPIHHPTTVHVEGEVSYRRTGKISVPSLKRLIPYSL